MWTTRANGANSASLPVARSSKRAPAPAAGRFPAPPCWPRECRACPACPATADGWPAGHPGRAGSSRWGWHWPRRIAQVLHGIAQRDAATGVDHRLLGCGQRGDGLGDGGLGRRRRRFDAAGTCAGRWLASAAHPWRVDQHWAGATSRAMRTHRPPRAAGHRRCAPASVLDDRHRQAEHIQFLEASVPSSGVPTWPVMQTIGTESSIASAMPVTRFEAPGPDVATQTPTWLLARAKPLATSAAPAHGVPGCASATNPPARRRTA